MFEINLRRQYRTVKQRKSHRACRIEAFEDRRLLSVSGPGNSTDGLPTISSRVDGANEIFSITTTSHPLADNWNYTVYYRTSVVADGTGTGAPGTDYTGKSGSYLITPGTGDITTDVTVPLIPNSSRDGRTFTFYAFQDMDQDPMDDLSDFNANPPNYSNEAADPPGQDYDAWNQLTVTIAAPKVDLNGAAAGTGFAATWNNNGPVAIADPSAAMVRAIARC